MICHRTFIRFHAIKNVYIANKNLGNFNVSNAIRRGIVEDALMILMRELSFHYIKLDN